MILQLDWEFGTCPIWLQEEQSLTLFSMTDHSRRTDFLAEPPHCCRVITGSLLD